MDVYVKIYGSSLTQNNIWSKMTLISCVISKVFTANFLALNAKVSTPKKYLILQSQFALEFGMPHSLNHIEVY